jgi:hypothetical protein
MNTKIAQQENSLYNNYWEVLGPGRISPNASENERNVIGKAKQLFNKYLAAFRKDFESEERRKYAVNKLVEALRNKTFAAGPMTYTSAAKIAQDNFYEIMEVVKKQVKRELEFGTGEGALDISIDEGGVPWTVVEWKNTLGMMLKRAAYQYGEVKIRETINEQDEKVKKVEMRIKSEYFSRVKKLLEMLGRIVNGDNPENKKLAPNDAIPDSWLIGRRGGIGGERRYPGGERRYPGGPGSLDEGFSEREKEFFNFPFQRRGRGDYLYVHELLRAYGLDTDPKYSVLMGRGSLRELPGRTWRSRDTYGALDTLGGDKAFFHKYVPALNAALNEIIDIYTHNAERYNPTQAEYGKRYETSTRHMMDRERMAPLKEEPERREVGTTTETPVAAPAERNVVGEWKRRMQHEEGFLDRINGYFDRRGFDATENGWLKKERGVNKIFVKKDTGEIYRAVGDGWRKVGNILGRHLEESKPKGRSGGSASFNVDIG